jgi:predicted RNase H-like HicB family nuclease
MEYYFAVKVAKGEGCFTATCPGVGGVYEEADSEEEVFDLAIESVMAIFEARKKTGSILTEEGPHLKILHRT